MLFLSFCDNHFFLWRFLADFNFDWASEMCFHFTFWGLQSDHHWACAQSGVIFIFFQQISNKHKRSWDQRELKKPQEGSCLRNISVWPALPNFAFFEAQPWIAVFSVALSAVCALDLKVLMGIFKQTYLQPFKQKKKEKCWTRFFENILKVDGPYLVKALKKYSGYISIWDTNGWRKRWQ